MRTPSRATCHSSECCSAIESWRLSSRWVRAPTRCTFDTQRESWRRHARKDSAWPDELGAYSRTEGRPLVRLPIRFVRINDTAIWSAPVEMFCEIAMHVREHSPFAHTMYFGYTNGWFGYLPRRRGSRREATSREPLHFRCRVRQTSARQSARSCRDSADEAHPGDMRSLIGLQCAAMLCAAIAGVGVHDLQTARGARADAGCHRRLPVAHQRRSAARRKSCRGAAHERANGQRGIRGHRPCGDAIPAWLRSRREYHTVHRTNSRIRRSRRCRLHHRAWRGAPRDTKEP